MSDLYLQLGYMPEALMIGEWAMPTALVGSTSNTHNCPMGYMAQPAIRKIADWAGWPNQQSLLMSRLGSPTSKANVSYSPGRSTPG